MSKCVSVLIFRLQKEHCTSGIVNIPLIEENTDKILPMMFASLYKISKEHWNQTIGYNVLKTLRETNDKLFGDLTSSYKAERQREKMKELEREELWKRPEKLKLKMALEKQDSAYNMHSILG